MASVLWRQHTANGSLGTTLRSLDSLITNTSERPRSPNASCGIGTSAWFLE
jgi:hypothetical protein